MEIIGWIKSLIAGLTEVGLMLLALAIVASLLVGGALPFFGGVVGGWIASRYGTAAVFAVSASLVVLWLLIAIGMRPVQAVNEVSPTAL